MTDTQAYIGALKFHLGNLMHGYNGGIGNIPMKIIRLYYQIAKDRAVAYIASGKHHGPVYMIVQGGNRRA